MNEVFSTRFNTLTDGDTIAILHMHDSMVWRSGLHSASRAAAGLFVVLAAAAEKVCWHGECHHRQKILGPCPRESVEAVNVTLTKW